MCVLSAILRIVHPEEYDLSVRLQKKLAWHAEVPNRYTLLELIQHWAFPFHRFDLTDNPPTYLWRDDRGVSGGINIISAFGDFVHGEVSFPNIGLTCDYNPGTVLCLPPRLFVHQFNTEGGKHFAIDHHCCSWTRGQVFREPLSPRSHPHIAVLPPMFELKEGLIRSESSVAYNYTPSSHRGAAD